MSGKKDRKNRQDLTALEDRYQIVGELSARDNMHEYLATRRDGSGDVAILVEDPPAGDAGNALTLFAADVNLLATLEHPNLIPIHEGRWVGQDRFAVVSERCHHPTIETLIGRGEQWSYPRIATILQQLNGLLDWARDQKVVHRAVTVDTVHLEPDTDRVLVSFIAQPLTRQGPPGPEGDARTIASLAWSLITRGRDLPGSPEDSLGVVRPELPKMVVQATDALLHGQRIGETDPPAVLDYIALVAMTDAIMRGEIEAARMQATLEQERRLEREDWSTKEQNYREQIAELERQMAQERDEAAATLAAERQQAADERAALEAAIAAEREEMTATLAAAREEMARTIEAERETLAATLETERTEMASTRADLERRLEEEREELARAIADERSEMHATLTREREQMATLRTDLERQIADEREQLEQDRARHEQEIAAERAAMAATIAEERAAMQQTIAEERATTQQTIADERARLEQILAEERERLDTERAEAEAALADARAEFEAAMKAQREEFDARLAAEQEAFDRAILAERAALDAEKEGLAVFNAAEREAIEAERRALDELYLAYEAEGRTIELADEKRDDDSDTPGSSLAARIPAVFADMAPLAVAQPVIEPAPDPAEPEETESGLTRSAAKRARRAAGGITASVLLLISIISAAAVGVGANRREAADRGTPVDSAVAADLRRAAQPTRTAAIPPRPGVVDSAAGAVVPAESLRAVPQSAPPAP